MIGNKHYRMNNTECRIGGIGFTLSETMVALSLFAVVVTISSQIFLSFQRISRKTEGLEKITTNARLLVESMAQEIRGGTVDYAAYGNGPLLGAQSELHLRNSSQASVSFRREETSSGGCESGTVRACVIISRPVGGNPRMEQLTDQDIVVRRLQFFIVPFADPVASYDMSSDTYPVNAQPRVTILLSLDNGKADGAADYARYEVQTTISSRAYWR